MRKRVEEILNQIRPYLKDDGGDVELVDIRDNVVRVRFKGACQGCPMSELTLKYVIEAGLKEHIPEIKQVIATSCEE